MKKIYLTLFFTIIFGTAAFSQSSQEIEGFKLFPNPTLDGKVFIETSNNTHKEIQIFDVLGTPVFQTILTGKELDIAHLNKGIYILRVTENNKSTTRKLVVK